MRVHPLAKFCGGVTNNQLFDVSPLPVVLPLEVVHGVFLVLQNKSYGAVVGFNLIGKFTHELALKSCVAYGSFGITSGYGPRNRSPLK